VGFEAFAHSSNATFEIVTPAQAGAQLLPLDLQGATTLSIDVRNGESWAPAFAGVTSERSAIPPLIRA
jgi:hypothetical protein